MAKLAAARRYARALFSLAGEEERVKEVRKELDALAALLEGSEELRHALFRPIHPLAERRAVLAALCERMGTSRTLRSFYSYLVDQRRMLDFPAIREEFNRLADEAAGRVPARVVSASYLTDEQQRRLRQALAARTGREVQLKVEVDEGLLGGLVAQVGDIVFDSSIRSHLEQLRSQLRKGH